MASLLNDAYRLALPQATVSDCDPHVLEVTVSGLGAQDQSASIPFTRCDTTPELFGFESSDGATPGSVVISNAVPITGIESPVAVAVYDGEYSIGCGATFTAVPGFIAPETNICVRHTASQSSLASVSTLLIVGGVSSGFSSTTSNAPPPPPPPQSGGGSAGLLELLVGLLAVFAGKYSIGCSTKFTSVPGFHSPGDKVCVRHTASKNFGSFHSTTLVVGGVSATFSSETSAAPAWPPPRM